MWIWQNISKIPTKLEIEEDQRNFQKCHSKIYIPISVQEH